MRLTILLVVATLGGIVGMAVPVSPTAEASALSATQRCQGVRPTIVGTDRGETLRGTPGRDVIAAGGGHDTVLGRGGDDLLCGQGGRDRLEGGPGDDRLHGQLDARSWADGDLCLVGDELDGGPGDDLLDPGYDPKRAEQDMECTAYDEVRFRHGAGRVEVDLVGGTALGQGRDRVVVEQSLSVVGSDGDDRMLGTRRPERFDGRHGEDRIRMRGGADFALEGDAPSGRDYYFLGAGADFLSSHSGADRAEAGLGDDEVYLVGTAPVRVHGREGDDVVNRLAVHDRDEIHGGEGVDELSVEPDNVKAAGTAELDVAAGVFDVAGRTLDVGSFETWGLVARMPLTFYGTDRPETVYAPGYSDEAAVLTAYMYGGDDVALGAHNTDDHVDGGDGIDEADLGSGDNTCINVELGPC